MIIQKLKALQDGTNPHANDLAWDELFGIDSWTANDLCFVWLRERKIDMLSYYLQHFGGTIDKHLMDMIQQSAKGNPDLLSVADIVVQHPHKDKTNAKFLLPILEYYIFQAGGGKINKINETVERVLNTPSLMHVVEHERIDIWEEDKNEDFLAIVFSNLITTPDVNNNPLPYQQVLMAFPPHIRTEIVRGVVDNNLDHTSVIDQVFMDPVGTPTPLQQDVLDALEYNSYSRWHHQMVPTKSYQLWEAHQQNQVLHEAVGDVGFNPKRKM